MRKKPANSHSHFVSVGRKRIRTIAVTFAVTVALVAGGVGADIAGFIPGGFSVLARARSGGTSAALSRAQQLQTFRKSTVRSVTERDIDTTSAQKLVNDAMKNAGEHNSVAVAIADKSGRIIASSNDRVGFEPASTMKTLTGFAASVTFDPGRTLDTKAMFSASEDSKSGTVTLVGAGDILLSAGKSDPKHITGRAGLETLAQSVASNLKKRGVASITLNYDDSLFGQTQLPSDLNSTSDINANYTNLMEPSSMAIDEARNWQTPANPDDEPSWYPDRSAQPAYDTAVTFAQLLGSQGVKVTNSSYSQKSASTSAEEIGSVSSAPMYEIIQLMLRNSDNSLAQLLGRLLAIDTGEENSQAGAAQAVKRIAQQYGIPTQGLKIADVSGLAPGSQVTIRTLIQIQSAFLNTASMTWPAAVGMPVNGLNGTLKNRDFGGAARGFVRAKTGTLTQTVALAGNAVRTKGGVLTFAIIVHGSDTVTGLDTINNFAAGLVKL